MWKDWYRIGMVSAVAVAVVVVALYVGLSRGPSADPTPLRPPEVATSAQTMATDASRDAAATASTTAAASTPATGAAAVTPVVDLSAGGTATPTAGAAGASAAGTAIRTPPPSAGPTTITTPTTYDPVASATPKTAASEPATREYRVQRGDTFASIARRELGGEQHWFEIAQANPLTDPNKLRVGQAIRIPAAGSISRSTRTPAAEVDGQVVYVVRPGDTLTAIARQYYSSETLWKTIFDANREKLGSDPGRLEAGTQLVIPPSPRKAAERR